MQMRMTGVVALDFVFLDVLYADRVLLFFACVAAAIESLTT
jgi:hypothetical protein